jgi:hypothetical protein
MSAVAKHLSQVEEGLNPTQAFVAWLAHASTFGSSGAYIEWAAASPDRNPRLTLPLQMIRAVKQAGGGQTEAAIQETTERAIREVLVRAELVLWTNDHLAREQRPDLAEVELLTETLPLALAKQATGERRARWRNRAKRLRRETFTWEQAGSVLAERYFGGQSAFFPDARAHFSETARSLDRLIARWNARLPNEPIALASLQTEAAPHVEPLIRQAVADARHGALAFLGERAGAFRIPRLMEYAERKEGGT